MLLAFIPLALFRGRCFIGASLLSSFGVAPTVAFLIIGPMVDIKNLIMMKHQFKTRFVGLFVGTASLATIIYVSGIGGDLMLRFLILSGYFELVMYLQVSGKLNQYINIHYSYLAYISMVLSFILAVVQLIVWMKQMKVHSHLSGRVAKVASIVLLAFPVLTGLLVPTVTLDDQYRVS